MLRTVTEGRVEIGEIEHNDVMKLLQQNGAKWGQPLGEWAFNVMMNAITKVPCFTP